MWVRNLNADWSLLMASSETNETLRLLAIIKDRSMLCHIFIREANLISLYSRSYNASELLSFEEEWYSTNIALSAMVKTLIT